MSKRFNIYLLRWQLGTPLYVGVMWYLLQHADLLTATIIANVIGACVFYKIDDIIFKKRD